MGRLDQWTPFKINNKLHLQTFNRELISTDKNELLSRLFFQGSSPPSEMRILKAEASIAATHVNESLRQIGNNSAGVGVDIQAPSLFSLTDGAHCCCFQTEVPAIS